MLSNDLLSHKGEWVRHVRGRDAHMRTGARVAGASALGAVCAKDGTCVREGARRVRGRLAECDDRGRGARG